MNKKGKKANSYWKMEDGSEHIAKTAPRDRRRIDELLWRKDNE